MLQPHPPHRRRASASLAHLLLAQLLVPLRARLLPWLLAPLPLLLLLPANCARATNNDPIVLVHGVLGFGPDQFPDSGFLYWGGYGDIAAHLGQYRGPHTVYTASLSALASNRVHAAELFAQIKGGCVTAARAEAPGTASPRCWAADPRHNPRQDPLALYPAWDAQHPLHLIGHSQGGTGIRALVELLEHGTPEAGDGELYQGGKTGWVRSVTTLSAPHNGTTLRDAVLDFLPGLRTPLRDWIEADLHQWELAPDGARDFNRWARTSADVYYFSLGTVATEAGAWCCNDTDRILAPIQSAMHQYPRRDMLAYYKPYAGEWIVPSRFQHGMGGYTQYAPGRVVVDSSWFANDGVVNTLSMRAPAGHPVRDFDGTAQRGTWNFLGNARGYDHFDILNWPNDGPSAYPIYERISDILFAL